MDQIGCIVFLGEAQIEDHRSRTAQGSFGRLFEVLTQMGHLVGGEAAERERDRCAHVLRPIPRLCPRLVLTKDGEEWTSAFGLRAMTASKPEETDEHQGAGERDPTGATIHYRIAENSAQPFAEPLTVFAPS